MKKYIVLALLFMHSYCPLQAQNNNVQESPKLTFGQFDEGKSYGSLRFIGFSNDTIIAISHSFQGEANFASFDSTSLKSHGLSKITMKAPEYEKELSVISSTVDKGMVYIMGGFQNYKTNQYMFFRLKLLPSGEIIEDWKFICAIRWETYWDNGLQFIKQQNSGNSFLVSIQVEQKDYKTHVIAHHFDSQFNSINQSEIALSTNYKYGAIFLSNNNGSNAFGIIKKFLKKSQEQSSDNEYVFLQFSPDEIIEKEINTEGKYYNSFSLTIDENNTCDLVGFYGDQEDKDRNISGVFHFTHQFGESKLSKTNFFHLENSILDSVERNIDPSISGKIATSPLRTVSVKKNTKSEITFVTELAFTRRSKIFIVKIDTKSKVVNWVKVIYKLQPAMFTSEFTTAFCSQTEDETAIVYSLAKVTHDEWNSNQTSTKLDGSKKRALITVVARIDSDGRIAFHEVFDRKKNPTNSKFILVLEHYLIHDNSIYLIGDGKGKNINLVKINL